jgi:hypothetical protein
MEPNEPPFPFPFGMQVGVSYVVTSPSKSGEFREGDHIVLCADGSIECREASGWLNAEDLPQATLGMTFVVA